MSLKKVFIASDHAGFELKKALMAAETHVPWEDLGTHSAESVDYPDFASALAEALVKETSGGESTDTLEVFGVLICGSGQGMAIRANRNPRIRAALCWNAEITRLSREHNSANVLVLPGRMISVDEAREFFNIFHSTPFAGGRHKKRVDKLGSC